MGSPVVEFLLIFVATVCATACCVDESSKQLRLHGRVADRSIELTIENPSSTTADLLNPTRAILPGEVSGIDIEVIGDDGDRVKACAMVEPVGRSEDTVVRLDSSRSIRQVFSFGTVERRYCLREGTYEGRIVLKQPKISYSSNVFTFEVE
jgi:hypothetical protein